MEVCERLAGFRAVNSDQNHILFDWGECYKDIKYDLKNEKVTILLKTKK